MIKRGKTLRTKFEYKYLFYTLSCVSINIGICNEYIKRKREKYKDEEHKIYFHLTEKNFEYIDKKKYERRIEKICKNFNLPLVTISRAANNYYPIDYHLQYLNDLFEKKKKKIFKSFIENEKKTNLTIEKQIDALIEDLIKHVEEEFAVEETDLECSPSSLFLRNLDWSYLKEFIWERKKVKTKSVGEFLDTFIDELYVYVYIYLLCNYHRNNFFDFVKKRRSYRHCSENVGKDIGLELNSYLGINKKEAISDSKEMDAADGTTIVEPVIEPVNYVLNIDTLREIQKSLSTYGVVVLKNFLKKEDIEKIKKELFLDKKEINNISSLLMHKDNNIFCIRPTRGRQYCILRNSKVSDLFTNIQQYWMNIIYSYLPIGGYVNVYDLFHKNVIFKLKDFKDISMKIEQNDKLFLSELQLVNNEPLSEIQSHHVDNGLSGISVILPLNKINDDSGNFEFFLGTHLFSSVKIKKKKKIHNFKKFMEVYYKTGSSFIPDINPQDIIIYDSKILHRGLSNNLWVKNSSLIYRYDYKKYPPPGQDFIDICSYNFIGKCISFFNFLTKYF
ncbi:hypothetical protein, conserved [Plasmodium gonderi]|uniref:Phytanoyl-CoA dioxygenase n=1 Tax=Plasmodium gonderi TaxID=77519 RepID=A0A1Y1JG82_PLAGO|nr:hypothetical protein, conserved [Plasmodium gonderi]GAW81516.1 hypothetical protein, conserved [Plasmodium gonderi]